MVIPDRERERDTVPLRTYLEQRLTQLESAILDRLEDHAKTVARVELSFDRRATSLENNFNHRLEQINEYKEVTRRMLSEKSEAIDIRLRAVENQIANWQGRLIVFSGIWGLIVVLLSTLLNFFIRSNLG